MTTSDESTPTAPSAIDPASEATPGALEDAVAADPLSPAVRRLVRQYELDITGIHGTGPEGRIRVGDVIGMLGARAEQAVRGVTVPRRAPTEGDAAAEPSEPPNVEPAPLTASTAAITTVFECDLGRVLAHRKRMRAEGVEGLLTSYFLAAFVEALGAVPELTLGATPRIGVALATAEGDTRSLKLDTEGAAAEALCERVRTIDAALRSSVGADPRDTNLLVHHYGASGSLLTTPTPLAAGHAASLGVGRARREIVLRNVDGDETPRTATRCYLNLSFLPEHVTLQRANHFLAHAVRLLEQWPE